MNELIDSIINRMGFEGFSKTEELSLGDNCVLLVDIRCGFINSLAEKSKRPQGITFWAEVYIRNGHLLPKEFPEKIRAGTGIEHFIPDIYSMKYEEIIQSIVRELLEIFKMKIWPYREQLIEFIRQNS
jgi:hypothetical protein